MALVKSCVRCGRLVVYPERCCNTCKEAAAQEAEERRRIGARLYNRERDKDTMRFYHCAAWRRLAQGLLAQRQYKCEDCGAIATEVHHDPPIQTPEGWHKRLDVSSLTCLCTECHNKRHKRFVQRGYF